MTLHLVPDPWPCFVCGGRGEHPDIDIQGRRPDRIVTCEGCGGSGWPLPEGRSPDGSCEWRAVVEGEGA